MSTSSGKSFGSGDLGRVARLTRKELRETLRDRRTVITLVLMPLLVYPLISISFNKAALLSVEQANKTAYWIGVADMRDADVLRALLEKGQQVLDRRARPAGEGLSGEAVQPTEPPMGFEFVALPNSPLESSVADNTVHAAVRLQPAGERWGGLRCELLYRDGAPISQQALRALELRLHAVNDLSLRMQLNNAGLPARVAADVTSKAVPTGRAAPFSLATLVPLVLILMTITGAVYPAIDLTAGERERGTLETLIAAPISRMSLLIAKYLAVLTVAVLTALVNLVAMSATVLSSSLYEQLFPQGMSFTMMIEVFGLTVLFAAFFSAIMLAVTSFARSFKEAQAYLIPIMLLAISPGLLSLMPDLQLTRLLAIAPLVNIVLLSRDLLEHGAEPWTAALAIVSTAVYALLAIGVAARVFGNDGLLYASRGSWSDLWRRPTEIRERPSASSAIACLATMFPCYFLLGNLAGRLTRDMTWQLLLQAGVSVIVFAVVPLLFAMVQRVRLRSGFRVRPASLWAVVGALILGCSLWPFAWELYVLAKSIGMISLDRSQLSHAEQLLRNFQNTPRWLLLVTIAVIQPICEEGFFRGFLFQGLRDRFRGPWVVLVTALLFGLFHVLNPTLLTPERFLPSTLLGIFLGWVCYRSGSLLPGILLHMLHNGLMLFAADRSDVLLSSGWNLAESEHIPAWWLATAAVAIFVACGLVWRGSRQRHGEGQN